MAYTLTSLTMGRVVLAPKPERSEETMRTNWKKKHDELAQNWQKAYGAAEHRARLIGDCLSGRVKFVARIPGFYSDEFSLVYRASDGTAIVVDSSGETRLYDSIPEMLTFWKTLSDLPHNVETRRILAEVA
jgi:hypothetical protein